MSLDSECESNVDSWYMWSWKAFEVQFCFEHKIPISLPSFLKGISISYK